MPKRYRKKRGRRRRRRSRAVTSSVGNSPLPNKFATSLRYTTMKTLTVSAGVAAVKVFSANGLFDPDYTDAGHQPRGWDQLMGMYDHCTVIGSKMSVQFNNNSSTGYAVGIALRDASTTDSNGTGYTEGGNVTYKMVGATSGEGSALVSKGFGTKFLGYSHPLSEQSLKNSDSANPTEQAWYHVFADGLGADAGDIDCLVSMEFKVVFSEPKVPSIS